MAEDKAQILTLLRDEYQRWEDLLASLSEAQIIAPQLDSEWSIKDVMAHLWAWQQRSIARIEAAVNHTEPLFPSWPADLDPETEDVDQLNAWLYESSREKSWATVYDDWRTGFQRFIELGEAVPENDLLDVGRYPWLEDYPLILILRGSYEHHEEHRGWLQAWLQQHNV